MRKIAEEDPPGRRSAPAAREQVQELAAGFRSVRHERRVRAVAVLRAGGRDAIAPEVLNAAVPNLILLPLAESAIANGPSVRPGRAAIEIRAWSENRELRLEVHESAAELEDASRLPRADSFALDESFLRKTKLRLELLYPGRHLIGLRDGPERGHHVSITLPLEEAARPAAAGASA